MTLLSLIQSRGDAVNIRVQREKDLDQLVDKDGREFSPLLYVQGDWDWEGVVTKREFLFGSPYQSFAEDIYEGKRTPDFSIYVTAAEEVA